MAHEFCVVQFLYSYSKQEANKRAEVLTGAPHLPPDEGPSRRGFAALDPQGGRKYQVRKSLRKALLALFFCLLPVLWNKHAIRLSSISFELYSPLCRGVDPVTKKEGWMFPQGQPILASGMLHYRFRNWLMQLGPNTVVEFSAPIPVRSSNGDTVEGSSFLFGTDISPDMQLRRFLQFKDILFTPDTNYTLWRSMVGKHRLRPLGQVIDLRTSINEKFKIVTPDGSTLAECAMMDLVAVLQEVLGSSRWRKRFARDIERARRENICVLVDARIGGDGFQTTRYYSSGQFCIKILCDSDFSTSATDEILLILWQGNEKKETVQQNACQMYAKFEAIISSENGFPVPKWGADIRVRFRIGNLIDRKLMEAVNAIAPACDENFPCALCEATLAEIRNLLFGPDFYEGKARTAAKHQEVSQSDYAEDATRNLGYRGKPLFRFNLYIIVLIDPMHLFMRCFEVILAVTVCKILEVSPTHAVGFHLIEKLVRSSSGQQHFRFYKADSGKAMGHGVAMAHNASDGAVMQAILIKFPFEELFAAIAQAWDNLPEALVAAQVATEAARPGRGRSSARGRGRGQGESRAGARTARATRGGISRGDHWGLPAVSRGVRGGRGSRGRGAASQQPTLQPQPTVLPPQATDEPASDDQPPQQMSGPAQQMSQHQLSVLNILKTRVPAIWRDFYNLVASVSVLPGHPRKMEESEFMSTAAQNRKDCHEVFGSNVEVIAFYFDISNQLADPLPPHFVDPYNFYLPQIPQPRHGKWVFLVGLSSYPVQVSMQSVEKLNHLLHMVMER